MSERCPTCGSVVEVVTADEGTSSYRPSRPHLLADAIVERYHAALVDLAGDYGCTLRTPDDPSEPPKGVTTCRDYRPDDSTKWCYACVASAALEWSA
jgi:hypothetical protein